MAIKTGIFILVGCLVAITVTEIYNLLPDSNRLYRMFPLSDQLISIQAWVDYGTTRIAYSVFFYLIFRISPKYSEQLFIFWLLSMVYFVDYIVFYNNPWGYVYAFGHGIPISFTSFRIFSFILIIIITIYNEWT